jgi:hypothetical protein
MLQKLLKNHGYQILSKNQKESVLVNIDGKTHLGTLEAEYTVRKNGKSFVVVVENSSEAIDPGDPALRRKILEYDRFFGLDGVLLVNPQREEMHAVSPKFPRERNFDYYFQFFSALFIMALVIGIIWMLVHIKLF